MDFIIRVDITVNGLAEEDHTLEMEQVMNEAYVRHPAWVDERYVNRVRSLNCYEAVRELLLNGTPVVEVARQIQLLNEWKNLKLETIRGYLEHFKQTLPKSQMLARMVPKQYVEVRKAVDRSLDTIAAMEDMYHRQIKRLDMTWARENAMQFLMPGSEKQYALAVEIISRLHAMKQDVVGDQREIAADMGRSVSANRIDWTKIYSSPNVNEIMANPDSRARLVRLTENLSKIFGNLDEQKQQKIIDAAKRKVQDESENRQSET